ncbi:MAG: CTP pyrophosphohydrolase [Candidatus Heimdallarchaeota archaeon LC_2]|nr:MAG: CTP pyrophosphohydrolase [Candidatus Heimdallarchaeota archaeon LC_2]
MRKTQILVVAAIIHFQDKILITQRSTDLNDLQPGLWEFPGGKVEFGENPKEALIREISEELEIDIYDLELYQEVSGMLYKNDEEIHAVMLAYHCKLKDPNVVLNYHNDHKWINYNEINNYEWAKLDIPIVTEILKLQFK